MKKLFTLFMGIIIALSAVAAPVRVAKSDLKAPLKTFDQVLVKKAHRAPQATQDITFGIDVANIDAHSATVTVTPSDETSTYYWDVFKTSDVIGKTDAELGEMVKEVIEYMIAYYEYYYYYTYEMSDFYVTGEDAYSYTSLNQGTDYTVVAVEFDANDNPVGIAGTASFTTETLVATDTIEHTFVEPVAIQNYGGDFYFVAQDENYILVMDYYSDTKAGEFALEDLYTDYVALLVIDGTDTTSIAYEDVNLKVVENETGFDIEVAYLSSDLHCYLMNLTSLKPVATDTIEVNWENAQHSELDPMYAEYYGFYHYILAANADSSLVITVAVNKQNLVEEIALSDLALGYCGVYVDDEYYMFEDAAFTATLNEDGSYTLDGSIFAENSIVYEFVITTAVPTTESVQNTNAAVKAEKVLRNGQLFIIKNGVEYNAIGTIVK